MESDTDQHKSLKIERLLNKHAVKKSRGFAIKYLVRSTGYSPEWDRWYNIKNLDNAADLVQAYEDDLAQREY